MHEAISTETARLIALHDLRVMDSRAESGFDALTRLAADLFEVPHAAIHLIDAERQWPKSFVGPFSEADREDSFCQFTIQRDEVLCVLDARADPVYREYAYRHSPPVVFYAGTPIRVRGGHRVGTLCISSSEARSGFSERDQKRLQQLGDVAGELLEMRSEQFRTRSVLDEVLELDPITGLRTRLSLLRGLEQSLEASSSAADIAIVKVRLNRMDMVQQAAGEQGRNAVLRSAAARLAELTGDSDLVARGDGDAFFLARIGAGMEHRREGTTRDAGLAAWADARAEAVAARMSESFELDGESVRLTVGIGMAHSGQSGSSLYETVDAADTAARAAQARSETTARWFDTAVSTGARHQFSVERRLRAAIDADEVVVAYQPVIDLENEGAVVGAEALARWPGQDPMVGSPAFFIPLAEELGLINALGRRVFDLACQWQAAWSRTGCAPWVSVNLSPAQLGEPDLAATFERQARAAGAQPDSITLEVTESSLNRDFDTVKRTLGELREIGFGLALDDFGTGFSSLTRIIRLPFTSLKIDRGFTSDCPDGPGAAVVSSVNDLAKSLGMRTIAEGVESDGHVDSLRREGVRFAQGYRYSRPLAPDDFAAWWSRYRQGWISGDGIPLPSEMCGR